MGRALWTASYHEEVTATQRQWDSLGLYGRRQSAPHQGTAMRTAEFSNVASLTSNVNMAPRAYCHSSSWAARMSSGITPNSVQSGCSSPARVWGAVSMMGHGSGVLPRFRRCPFISDALITRPSLLAPCHRSRPFGVPSKAAMFRGPPSAGASAPPPMKCSATVLPMFCRSSSQARWLRRLSSLYGIGNRDQVEDPSPRWTKGRVAPKKKHSAGGHSAGGHAQPARRKAEGGEDEDSEEDDVAGRRRSREKRTRSARKRRTGEWRRGGRGRGGRQQSRRTTVRMTKRAAKPPKTTWTPKGAQGHDW